MCEALTPLVSYGRPCATTSGDENGLKKPWWELHHWRYRQVLKAGGWMYFGFKIYEDGEELDKSKAACKDVHDAEWRWNALEIPQTSETI